MATARVLEVLEVVHGEEGDGEQEDEVEEEEVGVGRPRPHHAPSPLLVPDPSQDPSRDPAGLASPGMAGAMQALALASPVGTGTGAASSWGTWHRPPRPLVQQQERTNSKYVLLLLGARICVVDAWHLPAVH